MWDPCLQFSVTGNCQIFNFRDLRHSWKVTQLKKPPHPHPTQPWRFRKSNVMAFPFIVMALPVTGRSHLMLWRSQLRGFPMAWRRRQAMAKWRLGRRKWRGPGGPGMGAPRHFLRPQRHLAMAWRCRLAMGTPSNWERHNIKWERDRKSVV